MATFSKLGKKYDDQIVKNVVMAKYAFYGRKNLSIYDHFTDAAGAGLTQSHHFSFSKLTDFHHPHSDQLATFLWGSSMCYKADQDDDKKDSLLTFQRSISSS